MSCLLLKTQLYRLFPCLNRSRTHLVAVFPGFCITIIGRLLVQLTFFWMTCTEDMKKKINTTTTTTTTTTTNNNNNNNNNNSNSNGGNRVRNYAVCMRIKRRLTFRKSPFKNNKVNESSDKNWSEYMVSPAGD